jgi:hypothetical protein
MTDEHRKERHDFAYALEVVATLAENVPSFGWDVPPRHIAAECRHWAECYRVERDGIPQRAVRNEGGGVLV